MLRLLTLSHAARLVGVRRGALQSKIRSGELVAFEGMVSAEDLARVACASACCPAPRSWSRACPS